MNPTTIRSAQVVDTFFPIIDGVVQTVHSYASIMNQTSYSCVVCPAPRGNFDDSSLPYDVIRSASLKLPFFDYSVAWPINPSCIKKIEAIGSGEKIIPGTDTTKVQPGLDIIHFHSPFTQRDSAVKAAKTLGIPIVATFHTKYYDDIYAATKSHLIAKIVTDSVVKFYEACDSVWTCSESTAETLRSYGFSGEITVMQNGTNIPEAEADAELKEHAVERFGLHPEKKNLLFVGKQVWQKNLKLVLDTFKLLCNKNDDYFLTIVGTGSEAKSIMAYAQKLGLTNNQVMFTGKISDKELLSGVFLAADLLFFPSLYDNAPLVVREAAKLNTPSLLVTGSNSAEVIVPDENGFLAENDPAAMKNKIEQIFANDALRKKAGINARRTIPVSWEQIIPDVYEKYAEVIEKFKAGQ